MVARVLERPLVQSIGSAQVHGTYLGEINWGNFVLLKELSTVDDEDTAEVKLSTVRGKR